MNMDHVQGAVRQVAGRLQRNFGQVIGSPQLRLRGTSRELSGRMQRCIGDARQLVKLAMRRP